MINNKIKFNFIFLMFATLVFWFVFSGNVLAATNLLSNPGAETGNTTGWSNVVGSWAFNWDDLIRTGSYSFQSSSSWCSMDQTIDLLAAGYTAEQLDVQPEIVFTDYVKARDGDGASYPTDPYYLTFSLLDEDLEVVATYSYGSQSSPLNSTTEWVEKTYTFSSYGTGARYIYFKHAGDDTENWAGNYGTHFDDASVTIPGFDYTAEYWDIDNPVPPATPPIPEREADLTNTTVDIDFNWGTGAPVGAGDGFVARWTKTDTFAAGVYTFTLGSDDGSRFYIDDEIKINMWADQSYTTSTQTEILSAGDHDIRVEYYENASDARATFSYVRTDPQVSYFNPTDNTSSVAVDSMFEIAFDEDIATSTGDIVLYKTSDDSTVETIDITSTKVTASSTNSLLINPDTTLDGETEYYFFIDNTAVDDLSGNNYLGITASSTWSFTTTDIASPTTTLSPVDNTTDVAIDANLVMTFNEAVYAESGNIIIYKTSDDSTVETIAVGNTTGTGTTAITINPAPNFDAETEYYVLVDATAFDDASSNGYAGITASSTWSFTTEDIANPTATLSPLDDATGISIGSNIVLTFNEVVNAKSGDITLYDSDDTEVEVFDITSDITGSGTTEITINPASDLSYETSYYVQIDATAFDDSSSNSYAGIADTTTWSFTTEDTPTCSTVSNAATYNAYPTCGVATCSSGYTLTDGACVAIASGGGAPAPPPSVGAGVTEAIIGIKETGNIKKITREGINVLMYVWAKANFQSQCSGQGSLSDHSAYIQNLNLLNKKITVLFQSEPVEIELELHETKEIDLNNDGINDIKATFSDLIVNRVELTLIDLHENDLVIESGVEELIVLENIKPGLLIKNIKYPEIFYVNENMSLSWIINKEAAEKHFGKTWNQIIKRFEDLSSAGLRFTKNLK